MEQKREQFSGALGIIAATAGSAVGLGNIWRFPYVTGENGGGAFIIVYLIFVFGIGVPVMLSEMIIGRKAQANAIGSFKKLAPKSSWWIIGLIGVLASFIILAFYSTVAGWTLHYVYSATTQNLLGQDYGTYFINFKDSTAMPAFWHIVFMVLTAAIVIAGVQKGIEKYTKVLMPILFLFMIILAVRAVTLPGASEGVKFLFKPDFSKLDANAILAALGQAFFSLSVGMGTIITYSSYFKKKEKLGGIAVSVAGTDFFIAILAGLMIFPAVFAFGMAPDSGPGLVFMTIPSIFEQMPLGNFFAIIFFLLIVIAALTSSISLLEVVVAYFVEEFKMKRVWATATSAIAITVLGMFCTLSWSTFKAIKIDNIAGNESMFFFDMMDFLASNILLPLGGVLIVIFVGWKLGKARSLNELTNEGLHKSKLYSLVFFIVKYIAPIAIMFVFLKGVNVI
ncbi:MAG: sodium-dependent transporter [Bacteroidales bacterium]|jgi:NSS family neurotransmitter:Na+ symporter|nr:sodium-dependent transporter [Bacteroidales bacterium]